ncbi:MAG: hypothetical protein ACFFAE_09245 [Candidatus Hodarchaeota archaeon]
MKGRNQATLIIISLILISPCVASRKTNHTEMVEQNQNQNPILFIQGRTKKVTDWRHLKKITY